jgi:hypothetical protein
VDETVIAPDAFIYGGSPRPAGRPPPGIEGLVVLVEPGLVLVADGQQSVGEDVGGVGQWAQKALDQAEFPARDRRDRTQEVAGSSPASSMRNRRKAAVFSSGERMITSRSSEPQMHSAALGTSTQVGDGCNQRPLLPAKCWRSVGDGRPGRCRRCSIGSCPAKVRGAPR